jgi:hypothetical protein
MARDTIARGLALRARVLGQSAVAVPLTGTTAETTLATIILPAMGPNDSFEIRANCSFPATANTHILRVKLGSTYILNNAPAATSLAAHYTQSVVNRGTTNSQLIGTPLNRSGIPFGDWATALPTAAVETNAGATITITGQLSLGTETLTLEGYQVILYRG